MNLLFLLILISPGTSQKTQRQAIEELEFKTIEWTHPEPVRRELNNGMVLYLLEDHELPLIRGAIYIKAGSIYDHKDRVGIAEITASTLRNGGTKNSSPDEINDSLERDASRIEFYASATHAYCSFSALKENFSSMLTLLSDMLMNPVFNEDKLAVEISILSDDIKRRNDSPFQLASVNFIEKLRRGHPTGRFPTLKSVSKITRKDLIDFHKKYYVPNNMVLAIAGSFNTDLLVDEFNDIFKDWKKVKVKFPKIPSLQEDYRPKIYYVEKDVAQSTIIMGHLSIYRQDPDLYPLLIANRILGEGATSKLHNKIREEHGLAYVVGSSIQPGNFYRGTFSIFCQTAAKSTVQAIELILNEIDDFITSEPDSTCFVDAKESIRNSFVFTLESSAQIAMNAASLEFFNMPEDYYDKYIENIDKTDKKSVKDASRKNLLPKKLEILVVGNAKEFDKSLNTLGKVEEIKLKE